MRGVVIAGVLIAAGAVASAKQCVVEGKSVEPFPVTVAPKGGLALSLKVRAVEATAKIGEAAGPATVEVRGELGFSGVTPTDKLPLKWKSTVDSANGMLRLAAGAIAALDVHAKGRWVEGDLVLDGIRFRGVTFPCDGLTLDAVNAAPANVEPDEDTFVAKGKLLKLRAAASSGPFMEVALPEPTSISWHRVEHAGSMVRIAAKLRDGTYVTGWLKPSELTRPPPAPATGELGDVPIPSQACAKPAQATAGTQIVDAAVDANTTVMYDRLFQWATVRAGGTYRVRVPATGQWAELVGVPGVATASDCDADTVLDEAWIPRSAVHLAGEKPASPPDAGAKKAPTVTPTPPTK